MRPNGAARSLVDDEGHNQLAHIFPRSRDIVLGGTAQPNAWDLSPQDADRAEILGKAALLDPLFNEVEILSEAVGLRPARPTVRLELEKTGDQTVVHNYGHGGAGFTLSWGCAEEVVDLVLGRKN